jgi:hypothetical protein
MAKRRKKRPIEVNHETVYSRVEIERNQSHQTRKALYQSLEKILRRPVILYFTSFRYPVMVEDVDADMIEGILRSSDTTRGVAMIVSSPGGDGEAAERIVNICRSHSGTGEFWALVPSKAKSAATMICFGASKILMGPSSELGPVDPQIIFAEKGKRRQYSAYNLVTSYDALFDAAVKTAGRIEPYIQQLDHYDARDIQRYREAIELADDISIKVLKSGMMKRRSEKTIKSKIERFLKPQRTKSHGRPIFRDEAKDCGLNVTLVGQQNDRGWDLAYELYVRVNQLVSTTAMKCVESANDSYLVPLPG